MTYYEVGKRLGIPRGTIGNWVSRYSAAQQGAPPGELIYAAIKAENARLRKELAEVRMECEILKKATVQQVTNAKLESVNAIIQKLKM